MVVPFFMVDGRPLNYALTPAGLAGPQRLQRFLCPPDAPAKLRVVRGPRLSLSDLRARGGAGPHAQPRGNVPMRTTTVALPARVQRMRPEEVRAIRRKLKLSQGVFARLLNVPVVTEASWEVGRRNPSGAALRLLQIARKEPEVLLTAAEA